MPLATRALGGARSARSPDRRVPLSVSSRGLASVLCVVAVSATAAYSLRIGLTWERVLEPVTALIGLAIVAASSGNGNARVRHVRSWVGLGFGAWTASQLVIAFEVGTPVVPAAYLSLALLGGILVAALGAYWAALRGRVSKR